MNAQNAAIKILKEVGRPLHVKEIAQRAISAGLWETSGKTPDATVGAQLYSDIKTHGDKSAFVRVGPKIFALRDSYEEPPQVPEKSIPPAVSEAPPHTLVSPSFSFNKCAQKVLEAFGDKKPMHYTDITRKALEEGWLVTSGKTPEATMYAQMITEIKRQQLRGERTRFIKHDRGYFGLSQWGERGLTSQIEQHDKRERGLTSRIEQHNQQVRKDLRERLLAMQPGEFEELISLLLAEMGFEEVDVTNLSGDRGIDVRGILVVGDAVRIKMAVQAKKWKLKNNVPAPIVQQVRGSLGAHEQGLIITTSDFSTGAIKEAAQTDKTPISLMNGEQLAMLLVKHSLGV